MDKKVLKQSIIIISIAILIGVTTFFVVAKIAYERDLDIKVYDIILESRFKNPAHRMVFKEVVTMCHPAVPWHLALAVSEVESSFDQYAYSEASARGYYQLMYHVAAPMAKAYDMEFRGKTSIYDGGNNIYMGITHLWGLVTTYGDQLGVELYNVGYGNYFKKGKRNKDYVEKVFLSQKLIIEEFKSVKAVLRTNKM